MRRRVDRARLETFLRALGDAASADVACFLVDGSSAVQEGWRDATRDIDVRLEPDLDQLLRRISELKDRLQTNVEFASPVDFIPVPWEWRERSPFVARYGPVTVYHFDFVAQALAKIERDHPADRADVTAMLARGLVTPHALRTAFRAVDDQLHRFPAIDRRRFASRVEETVAQFEARPPRRAPLDGPPPPAQERDAPEADLES